MKHFSYLRSLFVFAFKNNVLLYAALIVSVISAFLELAAMTALMPLANLSADKPVATDSAFVRALHSFGMAADGRTVLLSFIALFAARILTLFVSQGLTIYLSKRILLQLNTRAFSALIRNVPVAELERKSIGYFISLVGDEASRASNLIISVSSTVSTILLGGLYFAAIATYSRPVAFAVILFLGVTFAVLFEAFRVSHRLGIRQIEESQTAGAFFVDAINALRSIRSYSAENYIATNHFWLMRGYMRTLALIDVISMAARLGPVLFLFFCAALFVLWPGGTSTVFYLDLPSLVTIIILLLRFFPTVGQALNLSLRVITDARAGRDVTEIIGKYQDAPDSIKCPEVISKDIETISIVNVGFGYCLDKQVLRDLSLVLRKGRSYALVGPSGSGKSTVLDLLLGFFAPSSGEIFVNGVSHAQIRLSDLRSRIALVAQDAVIFNDTVRNNICLGTDASQADVQRACEIACIDELIASLPKGYETTLNYKGSNLSGGQRQRIGIARALLRMPDVLLLDESTSALDPATRERLVQKLLEEFRSRVIVFVSHDSHVVAAVDEILHLSDALLQPAALIDNSNVT
jgi:ABC-type bacteriocin/lantibiotic exporter with double-glycine peptidase domain